MKLLQMVPLVIALGFASITYGEEIFSSDLESGTLNQIFDDVDTWGFATLSTDQAHSGSKSIRIAYSEDEAGSFFYKRFPFTNSLFTRKYERFEGQWAGNWPAGLKTSRYFTTSDYTSGDHAYMSEKLIWREGSDPDRNYSYNYNNAIGSSDLIGKYPATTTFGNGQPYITTNHWYKVETWMVLNSAVDVPDGVLQIWIDDQLIVDNQNMMWKSTARGKPNGEGWQAMWFGGNLTNYGQDPSETVYRYIDDLYLSTTLDRDVSTKSRPLAPSNVQTTIQ
ncbi:polysaccharide lyase [Oceanicoccus sp. KOV_DT_Chl]|uniref:polysaccharide lyase n=1 Tax=Oceanicoccus sp. KOV_DT_Chl TaxID=1904639 RepID=UPI000C7CFDE7|nr:hypothetical protein [Oceanicoccus sp. KOV_DT_Chl]